MHLCASQHAAQLRTAGNQDDGAQNSARSCGVLCLAAVALARGIMPWLAASKS